MESESKFKSTINPGFTDEYFYHSAMNIKWSAWGAHTLEVPEFHKENIRQMTNTLEVEDYQYCTSIRGHKDILASIIKNFSGIYGKEISEDQIIVTAGAIKSVQSLLTTLLEKPEDEVILFEPYYPYYFCQHMNFGHLNNIKTVPFKYGEGITIDYEYLEKTLTENSRVLIIINPQNPVCRVFTKEEYEKITKIIQKFPRLMVIEDAAYFPYLMSGQKVTYFHSIEDNSQRTFTVFSGGKIFNVTGVRCGWTIGPKEGIAKMMIKNFNDGAMTAVFEQIAIARDLESALLPYKGKESFWEYTSYISQDRYNLFLDIFKNSTSIKVLPAEGTYYCLLDVSQCRDKIPEKYFYRIDRTDEKEPYLDKAFFRVFIEKGIGFMPMTHVQALPEKVDYLVRVAINRNDRDFELLKKAVDEVLAELKL